MCQVKATAVPVLLVSVQKSATLGTAKILRRPPRLCMEDLSLVRENNTSGEMYMS